MATAAVRRLQAKVAAHKKRRTRTAGRQRLTPTAHVRKVKVIVAPEAVPKREKVKVLKGQISPKARAGKFRKGPRYKSIVGREEAPQARAKAVSQYGRLSEGDVLEEEVVNSSWVKRIFLIVWGGRPALAVEFNRITVVYPTTNVTNFKHMAAAASKGKYVWAALYHGIPKAGAPYVPITIR